MTARKQKMIRLINMVLKAAQLADELDVHLPNGAEAGSLLAGIYEDIKEEGDDAHPGR